MHTLRAIQRMRAVHAVYGKEHPANRISTHDVLDFATLQGKRTNGLADVTGSLTPGKKADLLVVRADDVNNMSLNDAVGTLALAPRNIDVVFVDGQPRKWSGQLVDVDIQRLRYDVYESRDAIRRRAEASPTR